MSLKLLKVFFVVLGLWIFNPQTLFSTEKLTEVKESQNWSLMFTTVEVNSKILLTKKELRAFKKQIHIFDSTLYPQFLNLIYNTDLPEPILSIGVRLSTIGDFGFLGYVHNSNVQRDLSIVEIDYRTIDTPQFFKTLIHELQHIYQLKFNKGVAEMDWLNEGVSEFLEYYFLNEPPNIFNDFFIAEKMNPLINNFDEISVEEKKSYYDSSFIFIAYLYTNYGKDLLLRHLIVDPNIGASSLNEYFKKYGLDKTK